MFPSAIITPKRKVLTTIVTDCWMLPLSTGVEAAAPRRLLNELVVIWCKPPRHQRPHVDDAQHPPAREHRRPEERLHALLAQDRVQRLRVVDVLDHDRRALRGDPPREAPPER